MILPEDTKAPIPFDDELDDDFASLPPSPVAQAISLDDSIRRQFAYDYPSSPTSVVTYPLLFPGENDIELGPAPPYTPVDPGRRSRRYGKGTLRKNVERRFILGVVGGIGVWVGLMGMGAMGWRLWGHAPRHGHGAEDRQPSYPKPQAPQTPDRHPDDPWSGQSLQCASLSPVGWVSFPTTSHSKGLPNPLEQGEGERRSSNTTFYIPTDKEEIFTDMFKGPAAIGPVFLSSYDARSTEIWKAMDAEEAIVGFNRVGEKPGKGEFIRVTVESIVDVQSGAGSILSSEVSPGWEMLASSSICLNQRGPGVNSSNAVENSNMNERGEEVHRLPGHGKPLRDAYGVSISTKEPTGSLHPDVKRTPLQFRVYIDLPSEPYRSPSLVDSLLSSFSSHPPPPPQKFLRSLDVLLGNSAIFVDDLDDVLLGEISLESEYGEVSIGKLRSDKVSIKTTGHIKGDVAISDELSVDTPVGKVDLNITVTSPSPFPSIARSPSLAGNVSEADISATRPSNPSENPCLLPPVYVDIKAGSDQATLRYVDWELPCRKLRTEAFSLIGEVTVYPHRLYQGPFHLMTAKGPINVDVSNADVADPEGLGRWRNITLEEKYREGSNFYTGLVSWELPREVEERDTVFRDENEKQTAASPSPPFPHQDRKFDSGIDVRTSVGAINIIF